MISTAVIATVYCVCECMFMLLQPNPAIVSEKKLPNIAVSK